MIYGGAKLHPTRIQTRESIGYAYSFDGRTFHKYGWNPVATRLADPNAAAFAEVHTLCEPPFLYIYHTLRYNEPWREEDKGAFPLVEHLGVQVLATRRPFSLEMPLLQLDALAPGATTDPMACPPLALALGHVERAWLTIEATFAGAATAGLCLHVRSSPDGLLFDTEDSGLRNLPPRPGKTVRRTFPLPVSGRYAKVLIENLSAEAAATRVRLVASLSG